MEEILDCVLVERQGFFVLLFVVCLGGLLDQLDGFLSMTMLYCLYPFSALASLQHILRHTHLHSAWIGHRLSAQYDRRTSFNFLPNHSFDRTIYIHAGHVFRSCYNSLSAACFGSALIGVLIANHMSCTHLQ